MRPAGLVVVACVAAVGLVWLAPGELESAASGLTASRWGHMGSHNRLLKAHSTQRTSISGMLHAQSLPREPRTTLLPRSSHIPRNLMSVQVAGMNLQFSAAPQSHPSYSSFSCTGLQWGESGDSGYGCPHCRTCVFTDVCLNHTSLQLQYYRGANNSAPLFYDLRGTPHYNFPPDFVNTAHVHIPPIKLDWGPTAVAGDVPADAIYSDAPVTAYASLNDFAGNFGHALFDFLFPVFNMLQLLNMYTPAFQLLLAQHQGERPSVRGYFITPSDADRSLLALISRRKALSKQQLADTSRQDNPGSELTCFANFVAGSGSLQATMQRTRALPFRSAAFLNMGMSIEQSLGLGAPQITMIKKKGRRTLENADEIVEHLSGKFPFAAFTTLDGDAVATMSIKQQLESMSRTAILITPCGGTGTVLTFLQPGATAVIMNYWHDVKRASVQMEAIYYWNLEYLDLQYFPVLAEDYEGTSDRPGCEKPRNDSFYQEQGAFIACNVRLKNMQRLEDVVANALRRWAVRHKQDELVSSYSSRT